MQKRISYIITLSGLTLIFIAAAGSDTESLSVSAIWVVALMGVALMVLGDIIRDKVVFINKKRSARIKRSATLNQLNYTPNNEISQGGSSDV